MKVFRTRNIPAPLPPATLWAGSNTYPDCGASCPTRATRRGKSLGQCIRTPSL
ncbi:hypothetical protein EV356DRAFT_496662 [Viridothelium virens]|uniref:Uncharacterized protein n=1 Tax=Viridothelium virens TaxID=1048519 RepID=A0A6A6HH07_VIRVR|nr:hypothetical protein EV356DRAFT_496662 [Viridothelium virens]